MYGRILKSLNIVNLYRGMSELKLKINVKVPQLLCIVVSVALNGEFERFGWFCVDCYYTLSSYLGHSSIEVYDIKTLQYSPIHFFIFEHKQTHCLYGLHVVSR